MATGNGVRIAHVDVGYWPPHDSTPRRVRRDLGYNFYENNTNTTDPGTAGLLRNPGHGTATMALLAGNTVDLIYQGVQYRGDFGGAPDAEVVSVRIGPSVIHFYSSAMAQGLDYALGPSGDPSNPNAANKCDVVTISHGGLPSESWADAVNHLYEAGIVIVAASGDNFSELPTHLTVYPSALNRVVTAVGATYDKTPYVTNKIGELQGSWGPDSVMEKAIAAYTPNVAWMKFRTTSGFDMDGSGTSASTPQIAAACALWIELYGRNFNTGWQRVEACRLALFRSAAPGNGSATYLGKGLLDCRKCLTLLSLHRSNRRSRPTSCSRRRRTAPRFRFGDCCSDWARPAAKRRGCMKPRRRNSSAAPPTPSWSTAFTPIPGASRSPL
jgi:Subtilase family